MQVAKKRGPLWSSVFQFRLVCDHIPTHRRAAAILHFSLFRLLSSHRLVTPIEDIHLSDCLYLRKTKQRVLMAHSTIKYPIQAYVVWEVIEKLVRLEPLSIAFVLGPGNGRVSNFIKIFSKLRSVD